MTTYLLATLFYGLQIAALTPAQSLLDRLPTWALPSFDSPEFRDRYVLSDRLNPFYVCGDFDDDHLLDIAVLVRDRRSAKEGLGIFRRASGDVRVFGAGTPLGSTDDLAWINLWRAENRRSATLQASQRGDMLFLDDVNFGGGVLWWDELRGWQWTAVNP